MEAYSAFSTLPKTIQPNPPVSFEEALRYSTSPFVTNLNILTVMFAGSPASYVDHF
ncbi:uncharacterized protein Z519_11325 [Cladophialophora bantiana CBS 173.52]|uniref:Uncharacterized protein n=1 Tax=Cladophialophora bantiana (strain ATCC 10958 / CBS 173.52 / CDC B-1940 / NIH 8579) TaxID=1442370 RepID=A0A0D2HUJ2_CLAB1|nr:uncharacterized protein Z519_11325 [Cladophialophora bantiana CBS 173.52]KIW88214.1 hypothetical protein Z519_11325 [Cladophialophora bantiana CBS 173.52]